MTTSLEDALVSIGRSWNPVPVSRKTKKPIGFEWQKRRITARNAAQFFNGRDVNIGVQMGGMAPEELAGLIHF